MCVQATATDDHGRDHDLAPTITVAPPTTTVSRPRGSLELASAVSGFSSPWEIVFLPDGTPLVTERSGRLVRIVGGTRSVVAVVPDVHAAGEGGLMGMAIDPGVHREPPYLPVSCLHRRRTS